MLVFQNGIKLATMMVARVVSLCHLCGSCLGLGVWGIRIAYSPTLYYQRTGKASSSSLLHIIFAHSRHKIELPSTKCMFHYNRFLNFFIFQFRHRCHHWTSKGIRSEGRWIIERTPSNTNVPQKGTRGDPWEAWPQKTKSSCIGSPFCPFLSDMPRT